MRLLHVVAGSLGLLSGAVALFAPKGATLHRTIAINVIAGVLTFYVVLTALLTVRRPARHSFREGVLR